MDEGLKILKSVLGESRLKENEPLKYHLNLETETAAEFFYIATSQKELIDILNMCEELKVDFQILGAGQKLNLSKPQLNGLTIKNRSNAIKLSGIKGKVGAAGLGIESALLEVDSGTSIQKLNDYLLEQKLVGVDILHGLETTVGDSVKTNPSLQNMTETIKIWDNGVVVEMTIIELKEEVILSVVLRVHARN
jgi:UDP-N-acetylenolpyruvoylglucosamine reductase